RDRHGGRVLERLRLRRRRRRRREDRGGRDCDEGGQSRAGGHDPDGAGRTAIVIRVSAHRRPSSSAISTSHTHVVRPPWRSFASALTWPLEIGRRKLVWFDCPIAIIPSSRTPRAVPAEQTVSARDVIAPPWTTPYGCRTFSVTGIFAFAQPSPNS